MQQGIALLLRENLKSGEANLSAHEQSKLHFYRTPAPGPVPVAGNINRHRRIQYLAHGLNRRFFRTALQ